GRAETQREQARQDAGHDQHRTEQNRYADCVERGRPRSQILANACDCILIDATLRRQPRFVPKAAKWPVFRPLTHVAICVVSMVRAAPLWESARYSNEVRQAAQPAPRRDCRWT